MASATDENLSSFQLPLSGSPLRQCRLPSGPRSRLSTPSLGITLSALIFASGMGSADFQLPLSGSHQPLRVDRHRVPDFQLPLSGSRKGNHGRGGLGQEHAFNSLSRDHLSDEGQGLCTHLQRPFNSLSRDHGTTRTPPVPKWATSGALSTPSLGITDHTSHR